MTLGHIYILTETSIEICLGAESHPRGADNLTGLVCRLSKKMGVVTSCHPMDLLAMYKGYLYQLDLTVPLSSYNKGKVRLNLAICLHLICLP